jgi:putative ABC transport system permease protein
VAAAGIGFASLLMFMELGFYNALLDSTVEIFERLDADLVMTSRAKFALPARERFHLQRLNQAMALADADATPIYMETVGAQLRRPGHKSRTIRVIAWPLDKPGLKVLGDSGERKALGQAGTAIYDKRSKPHFGFPDDNRSLPAYDSQLVDQPLHLVGSFRLGTDFANTGNLIMSPTSFARYFAWRAGTGDPLSLVDLGALRLRAGANPESVARLLNRNLPNDVQVMTRRQAIEREKAFWRTNAPIGYIFSVGAVMGFIVGTVICYQIIYADITDHLPEFATLKAMGYKKQYFLSVVIWQSFYLSWIGFVPGALVSWGLYYLLGEVTGLMMMFRLSLVVSVWLATVLMCICSGLFALRKLSGADPADLF